MAEDRIKKIIILGNGARLSLAGAILVNSLKEHGVSIECWEQPAAGDELIADSLGPEVTAFHRMIELPDPAVVSLADAGFHLGYSCQRNDSRWFVPFGPLGLKAVSPGLEAAVYRYVREHPSRSLQDFSLAAQAALHGRFGIPAKGGAGIAAALTSGFSIAREKYSAVLRQYAEKAGVGFNSCAGIATVERDDRGFVRSLITECDQQLSADLWVALDSFGPAGLPFSDLEPADTKVSSSRVFEWISPSEGVNQPGCGLAWTECGWLKSVSLQSGVVYQLFQGSKGCDHAHDWLVETLSPPGPVWERLLRRVDPSWRPWQHNVLSLGPQLKGVVFSDLTLLLMQLSQFLDLYPSKNCPLSVVSAYNCAWKQYVQEAMEFEESFTDGPDGDKWTPNHNGLRRRWELFTTTGQLPPAESDAVRDVQWQAQLFALGAIPQRDSVFLNAMEQEQVKASLMELRNTISGIAQKMPRHNDVIQKLRRLSSSGE